MTRKDDYNRADETPIAGNWTTITSAEVYLSGNAIIPGGALYDRVAFRNSEAYNSDQYSRMRLKSAVASAEIGGPMVRVSAPAADVFNGYYASILNTTTGLVWVVWGNPPDGEQVGADFSGTFAQEDEMTLAIRGQVLYIFQNGVLTATRTDSNNRITSGGAAGVMVRETGTIWDDWEGGDATPIFSPFPVFKPGLP